MQTTSEVFVGIDVSKASLDVGVLPQAPGWTTSNDAAGQRDRVARLQALAPTLIVLEATEGDEVTVTAILAAAGLPVVVANPRQVRNVAKANGILAKTDRLDAHVLALFAERLRPPGATPQRRPTPRAGGLVSPPPAIGRDTHHGAQPLEPGRPVRAQRPEGPPHLAGQTPQGRGR